MEDFFDYDKLKASVYLLKEGDQKNMALVSDEHIFVRRDGHKKIYELRQISQIRHGIKKSLLPLFIGGIFTPFAILSYFANMFHPIFHLIGTLLGMLLFYIGWAGKNVLILQDKKGHEENIFLPTISPNLLAFIDYLSGIIAGNPESAQAGFIYFREAPDRLTGSVAGNSAIFPVTGYTWKQMLSHRLHKSDLTAIDPAKAGQEIKFVYDLEIKEMRPVLEKPVDVGAIVENSGRK